MKRRHKLLVFSGIIVAAVLVAALWPGEKEPEYQGKKLSEWLEIYRDAPHDGSRSEREAVVAVRQIGANAFPWLDHWAVRRVPSWREGLSHRSTLAARWDGPFGIDLAADAAQGGYQILRAAGLTNGASGR